MPITPVVDPFLTQLQIVAQIANTLGTIGLLLFLVLAFYRGDLISKPVYDKMVDKLVEGFSKELERKFHELDERLSELKNNKKPGAWS